MDLVLSSLENTTTIGFVSFIILCLFIFRFSKVSQAREAPTISGAWPILGHLPLLSGTQTPHKTLGELADKYGPLFTIKIGSKRALVLNNWELAKECFTTIDKIVSSRPKLIAVEIMAYNRVMFGFAPYGPYWRQMRKIVTLEVLTNRRVEQLQHVRVLEVQTSIKELFDVWRNKKNEELNNYVLVELKEWFTHLAFNMVLQMAVGKRYFGQTTLVAEEEAQRCVKALKEFMRLLGVLIVGDAIPCLKWFDIGGHMKGMKKTAKELDNITGEWLEEHCQNRVLGEKLDSHPNFMDVMISLLDGKIIEEIDADNAIKSSILGLLAA